MKRNHEYKCLFLDKIYDDYEFPHVNYRGGINTSSVNCGKPILHLDIRLNDLFYDVSEHIRNYCHQVLLISDLFDIQIMKSWMSRSYSSLENVPAHIHSTSHISFVYYLNITEHANCLTFLNKHQPNLLFPGLDDMDGFDDKEAMLTGYNFETTSSYSIEPHEGTIVIFPSHLTHMTTPTNDQSHSFKRLAIVGDALLTLKKEQPMIYSQGFISPQYWKTFSRK